MQRRWDQSGRGSSWVASAALSGVAMPEATISAIKALYSCLLPSQKTTLSGAHRLCVSSMKLWIFGFALLQVSDIFPPVIIYGKHTKTRKAVKYVFVEERRSSCYRRPYGSKRYHVKQGRLGDDGNFLLSISLLIFFMPRVL